MDQYRHRVAGVSLLCSTIGIAGGIAAEVQAQTNFPARPIRILVGSAPGGGLDTSARAISEPLATAFNQPVVVDNRPGAAGSLAGQMLSKAPADGHTICLGAIGNFAVNYFVYKDIGYHPLKDLAPVSGIADATNVLVVHTGIAATSVKELLQLAAREKGLTYGSSGTGNAGHLAGELFSAMTKSDLVHVPYKGGGPAMIDLLGGRITMIFASPSTAMQQVKAGKVRALAVTTAKRSALVPELPTISESGVPGFDVNNWYGMAAPAGTPPAIIARLNRDIVAVLKSADVAQVFLKQGLEPAPTTPEAFGKFIRSEFEKWGRVLKAANVAGR
ncbi:MAG: Bug family tripartite tricarboxylate transporter substrate binding protein [bacterium]|jgi:tripartite-type tricarboxylate transporter receptor subunit TctC|nr:tripartite tricarboxylate transporter substrate binding protein [Betaproteobacteria bacterium]